MKNYEKPIIDNVGIVTEGVYAASGSVPAVPIEPIVPKLVDWEIKCSYCNHNTGSHSEVKIDAHNYGTKSGEGITMFFVVRGFKLDTVKDSSGYVVSNVTETGFTIYRKGHFNPNENIVFVIQITAKDSKYHGSVGVTGVDMPCEIYCCGYMVS